MKEKKTTVDEELILWNNTQTTLDSTAADSTLIDISRNVIIQADSTGQAIADKTNELIALLSPIAPYGVEAESLMEKIDAIIAQRQGEVFTKTHPSVLEINYTGPNQWALRDHLDFFYEKDINALIIHYKSHRFRFFHLLRFPALTNRVLLFC